MTTPIQYLKTEKSEEIKRNTALQYDSNPLDRKNQVDHSVSTHSLWLRCCINVWWAN